MSERITVSERRKSILMEPCEADIFILRQRKRSLKRWMGNKMEERKVKGYGEGRRKVAKLELLKICETIGVVEGKTRALALFSLRTGHTMQRAETYLDELVAAGLIEVEGNRLISESLASKKRLEEIKNMGMESTEEEV